jgi:hypothetical protein
MNLKNFSFPKMFFYLLIVNKNGSLIYDKSFSTTVKLSSNEVINIASIFYSMHAISSKLTPPGYEKTSELKLENGGIEVMEANSIRLICYQTLTKIKFIFVTDYQTNLEKCQENFRKIYDVYSDVVAKNPNYELDMPIRVNSFDEKVNEIFI